MRPEPVFAVSTWSLHRTLGTTFPDSPDRPGRGEREATFGGGTLSLMALPETLRTRGISCMELCHFHCPRSDNGYLKELASSMRQARVILQTLLIDDGDLADPDASQRSRDIEWIKRWIEAGATLGASHARVIAGKQPPTAAALAHAVAGLKALCGHAKALGMRLVTENWFALTASPNEVNHILDALEGEVGFLADTGNWNGPTKYTDLAAVYGRAERSHTKAHFGPGLAIDAIDYGRCLDAARQAGYSGPHTLIYEGENADEWAGLTIERDAVLAHTGGTD